MKKILIYDDDLEILQLCKAILASRKFIVSTLSRCENILTDIETIQPDLILMDLWIPDIGGEKAVGFAKQHEHTKHTPILLFSANADIKEISVRVNANGYLEKPFSISTFIDTIQKHAL